MQIEEILKELENIKSMKFAPALHVTNKIAHLMDKIKGEVSAIENKIEKSMEQPIEAVKNKIKNKHSSKAPIAPVETVKPVVQPKMIPTKEPNIYTPNVSINPVEMAPFNEPATPTTST